MGETKYLPSVVFDDELAALEYVEGRLWPDGPICPYCGGRRVGRLGGKTTRTGLHKCYACRKPFTVKTETLFEGSHVPLHKWLQAIHLHKAADGGVTAEQIHRELGVTHKTAYFVIERIADAVRAHDAAATDLVRSEAEPFPRRSPVASARPFASAGGGP
jgi:transposase-like protein